MDNGGASRSDRWIRPVSSLLAVRAWPVEPGHGLRALAEVHKTAGLIRSG